MIKRHKPSTVNYQPILLSWSGGKDSALALYELLKARKYRIISLITTISKEYKRSSMHGIRIKFIEKQADYLRIPLIKIILSKNASNRTYEAAMRKTLLPFRNAGVKEVAFGDIYLAWVRSYRQRNLKKVSMRPLFPLWGYDTRRLARRFTKLGFKAITTCVDTRHLGKEFAGREYDDSFLDDLPKKVDPCGENGEFHTFVYGGPIFKEKIQFKKGRMTLKKNRYLFCDIR